MNIEILIFFYMGVCVSMILFNCAVIILNILRRKQKSKRDERLETAVKRQMERLKQGLEPEEEHGVQMKKNLEKLSGLELFEDSMDFWMKEDEALCRRYLESLAPCFRELAPHYFRKGVMEATCFTHLLRKYGVVGPKDREFWTEELMKLLQTSSVCCRENALHILYNMGYAEDTVNALLLMDRHHIFHHEKLIHDGLLEFKGDKQALLEKIWSVFDRFSPDMQVALLSYMRLSASRCCQQVFEIMIRPHQNDEVYFACLRYFGKFYYEPVYPILIDLVSDWDGRRWEFASIAASVLGNYPSERTIDVLVQALYSSNWYIRNNAAEALERLGMTYTRLAEVFEGNDRYAREILQYWLDYREVKEGGSRE